MMRDILLVNGKIFDVEFCKEVYLLQAIVLDRFILGIRNWQYCRQKMTMKSD